MKDAFESEAAIELLEITIVLARTKTVEEVLSALRQVTCTRSKASPTPDVPVRWGGRSDSFDVTITQPRSRRTLLEALKTLRVDEYRITRATVGIGLLPLNDDAMKNKARLAARMFSGLQLGHADVFLDGEPYTLASMVELERLFDKVFLNIGMPNAGHQVEFRVFPELLGGRGYVEFMTTYVGGSLNGILSGDIRELCVAGDFTFRKPLTTGRADIDLMNYRLPEIGRRLPRETRAGLRLYHPGLVKDNDVNRLVSAGLRGLQSLWAG